MALQPELLFSYIMPILIPVSEVRLRGRIF